MAANLTDRERAGARARLDGRRARRQPAAQRSGGSGQAGAAARGHHRRDRGPAVKSVADVERADESGARLEGSRESCSSGSSASRERMLTVVEIGTLTADDPPREARKAWVPVEVQVLTPPLAERLGLKGKTGVRVTRLLDPATPLHLGDIILAIDGDPVRATAPNDDDLFASDDSAVPRRRVRQAHDQSRRHGDAAAGDARPDADAAARDEVVRGSGVRVPRARRRRGRSRGSARRRRQRRARRVRGRARLGVARAAERRRPDPVDRRSAGGGRRRRSRRA